MSLQVLKLVSRLMVAVLATVVYMAKREREEKPFLLQLFHTQIYLLQSLSLSLSQIQSNPENTIIQKRRHLFLDLFCFSRGYPRHQS
ncbi:hypothetical protein RchiOBHm_Chr2g0137641 [Rosa chinensis]|uniref:Secreted protein n=1 Tax=Rosa chinensis TaxID=74649 RepID=A0A2P6RWM9_ROSCH|nr:hypothetical protein RchiOBHm_Chr2g0137641 [Rosa chinensis]